MKILLVHADKKPWATTQRAFALKKEWVNDEVDIAFYKDLPDGDKYDIIHILFSGGVGRIKDYILKHKDKTFTTLASQRTLDNFYDQDDVLREIFGSSICCVCLNPKLMTQLSLWQENVVFIPNGVDTERFNRKFVVGFVGEKHQANRDHKGFNLVEKACDELGLELLSMGGELPYERMFEFYEQVDCLVIPSLSEGCNNPTLEALAMNTPVVSTDTGIATMLEGVILIERDVESIKDVLRKLSGRIQILEDYRWSKIANQYRKLYVRHLGKSGKS